MKKTKECPICNGEGQIQSEVSYDNNDIPLWNLEECPQCDGTGEVKKSQMGELSSKCCGARVGQKGLFYTDHPFELLPKLPDSFYYCQGCGKRCEIEEKTKEEIKNVE